MKNLIIILSLFISSFLFGQNIDRTDEIINLAKFYKNNHGFLSADISSKKDFEKYKGTDFEHIANFVLECCLKNNEIATDKYLTKPDSISLKLFHTIIMVNYNMFSPTPEENGKVVYRYLNEDVGIFEQIDQYYSSLFTSVVNKNRPFDYSKEDWNLDRFQLKNEQEKAIFFMTFVDHVASQISSYYNAMKGPNWDGIEKYVVLLPKINGKDYYSYDEFYFKEFKMEFYRKNRKFKDYFIPKFYDVLIGHFLMMKQKGFSNEETTKFLLTSILSQQQYYDYCKDLGTIKKYLVEKK